MKVAFFGTPDFAVNALKALLDSKHQVVVAVSQPDRPAGRGRKLQPTPVRAAAEEAGIPVLQPERAKDPAFAEQLAAYEFDAAVVVAFGQILPRSLFDRPRHGYLNIHASLLPKYRGAAPIQWAIARGERATGVSIMRIDEGLDSGPVLAREVVDILEDDDSRSLAGMLSLVGARLMVDVLDRIDAEGDVEAVPQDASEATLAPLIGKRDARIDWSRPAEEIICQVRAFVVWPGAWTEKDGEAWKILGAGAVDRDWLSVDPADDRLPDGTVLEFLREQGPVVRCAGGQAVVLTRLQLPGKRPMSGIDAVNGGLVAPGVVLGG